MAQYKVPQDVEADDKLLGPFTFRQFVYLMITCGAIGLAILLFQVFPMLAIIPLPFILFFGILALPFKKDQPMEVYLAALVSYYFKPKNRVWTPGQRESTILVTAPKQNESKLVRDFSGDEAKQRLSFLADVVDTEGYSIRGDLTTASMQTDFLREAKSVPDILDNSAEATHIEELLSVQSQEQHDTLVAQMREAIKRTNEANAAVSANSNAQFAKLTANIYQPQTTTNQPSNPQNHNYNTSTPTLSSKTAPNLQNLSVNSPLSVQTLSIQANRGGIS